MKKNRTTQERTNPGEKKTKYLTSAVKMAKNRITKNRKAKEQALKKTR